MESKRNRTEKRKTMETIAFVGPAGTGKSDRALVVAYENKCACIIDDGILIYRNRIVAGKSAKKEPSPIAAVRRAIFQDSEQAADVRRAVSRICPMRILILGTSDRMVRKITEAIGLPAPKKTIRIEDIAKPEEIERASEARHKEGKHIIPVPTMELKPEFKGYLIDPIRSLFRKGNRSENMEKSVIRPSFSYYGKLTFANRVMRQLVLHALEDMKGNVEIRGVRSRKDEGESNGIRLSIEMAVKGGTPQEIKAVIHEVRDRVQKEIEYTTGMSVEKIRITLTTGVARN